MSSNAATPGAQHAATLLEPPRPCRNVCHKEQAACSKKLQGLASKYLTRPGCWECRCVAPPRRAAILMPQGARCCVPYSVGQGCSCQDAGSIAATCQIAMQLPRCHRTRAVPRHAGHSSRGQPPWCSCCHVPAQIADQQPQWTARSVNCNNYSRLGWLSS